MFSYYGRKKKIIKKYPKPEYDTIIESFCGSASYAYEYWDKNIIIIDKYPVITGIFRYLQNSTYKDIISLPNVGNMENIEHHTQLVKEEKWLIGFCINNGSTMPKKTARNHNFNSWNRDKIRIANDLHKIKHWKIINGEYNCIDNLWATWFVDPPYQHNIYKYGGKLNDYKSLGIWCKERNGQVIVCENYGADWLDFKSLTIMSGQVKPSKEMIWTK